jgi:NADH-quinone oxidoreductase subunit I
LGEIIKDETKAFYSGVKHIFKKRFTLRYPEWKLTLPEGLKGRHLLFMEKCTGCKVCAKTCEGITQAISMVKVHGTEFDRNRNSVFPQFDYGKCCFCSFCVDVCPSAALEVTDEYHLAGESKDGLLYTPKKLSERPLPKKGTRKVVFDKWGSHHD